VVLEQVPDVALGANEAGLDGVERPVVGPAGDQAGEAARALPWGWAALGRAASSVTVVCRFSLVREVYVAVVRVDVPPRPGRTPAAAPFLLRPFLAAADRRRSPSL